MEETKSKNVTFVLKMCVRKFCKLRILSGDKDYKSLGYQLNCLTCKMLKMISNSGIFTKFFRTQKK